MSLHFHDSLFADFSFAQGKSIRCLCFAQLRTSLRLADNVACLADVRRDHSGAASSSMVKVMVLTSLFFEIKSGFFEHTLESHNGIASSLFVFRTPVARRLGGE